MQTLVLDAINKTLEAVLSQAANTVNPEFVCTYADYDGNTFVEGSSDGVLNDITPVTLVEAPAASTRRIIRSIIIYNRDDSPVTITFRYNNNTAIRRLYQVTLQSGETFTLDGCFTTSGKMKIETYDPGTSGDVSGPASSNDNRIARFDGATGKLIQESLASIDDSGTIDIPANQTYNINGSEHTHDNRYFQESEHIDVSSGVGDAGKPVKLDAAGKIDFTMIDINGANAVSTLEDSDEFLFYDSSNSGNRKITKANLQIELGGGGGGETFKISSNDSSASYFENKVVIANGINLANPLEGLVLNDGNDEDYQIRFDSSKVNHSDINDDEASKHRLINDSGSLITELWSASKIDSEILYQNIDPIIAIVDCTQPPPDETNGNRYVLDHTVGTVHTDWDGCTKGQIAEFDGVTWSGTTPSNGWLVRKIDNNFIVYDAGNNWLEFARMTPTQESNWDNHISSTSNPHSVTYSQVDAIQREPDSNVADNALVRWDGTSGNQVQSSLVSVDDNGTLLLNIGASYAPLRIYEQADPPSNPVNQHIYLDNGNNTGGAPAFRRYNGASWETIGGDGSGGAVTEYDTVANMRAGAGHSVGDLALCKETDRFYQYVNTGNQISFTVGSATGFQVGDLIELEGSGVTGVLYTIDGDTFYLVDVNGTFQAGVAINNNATDQTPASTFITAYYGAVAGYDDSNRVLLTNAGIPNMWADYGEKIEYFTLYVGKHGNDSDDGLTSGTAFKTFMAAITAAISSGLNQYNRYRIICNDAGNYTENLTIPAWIFIDALSAVIIGNHTMTDTCVMNIGKLVASSGTVITRTVTDSSLRASLLCHSIAATGNTNVFDLTGGSTLDLTLYRLSIENGTAIYLNNNGDISGYIGKIDIIGNGRAIGIYNASASANLLINSITDSGSGTSVHMTADGTVNLVVGEINTNVSVDMSIGVLDLHCTKISGTINKSGGVFNYISSSDGIKTSSRSYLGIPNSAPNDDDIENSQMSVWYDETVDQLQFRVKTAAGAASTKTILKDTSSFRDADFEIYDGDDDTRVVNFNCGSITTATTRVVTIPDRNVTLDTLRVGSTGLSGFPDHAIPYHDASTDILTASTNLIYSGAKLTAQNEVEALSSSGGILAATSSDTSIAKDDTIGRVDFNGNTDTGAKIKALADGSWGTDDYPTRLTFELVPDNSDTLRERFKITSDGKLATNESGTSDITTGGLSLDQLGASAEIFAVKSTATDDPVYANGVDHGGLYGYADSAFGAISQSWGSTYGGGLRFTGVTDASGGDNGAINFRGVLGVAASTDTTGPITGSDNGSGIVTFVGSKHNNAGDRTDALSNENVFSVRNNTTVTMIGKGNSDWHIGGTLYQNAFDFAEYMESENGKAIENGTTVVFGKDGKIRPCKKNEIPIGVISATAGVIGNSNMAWKKMYLTDEFGARLTEEKKFVKVEKRPGSGKYETYPANAIPEHRKEAKIVERFKETHYIINPDYNPGVKYKHRQDRPEWNVVGLLGQCYVAKKQPVNPNWIFIREANEKADLYLIK